MEKALQSGNLSEITWHESLELLRSQRVGRLAVIIDGRPDIFPVNFSLDASDSIIVRTAAGRKLNAATNHHVSFEVDHFDADQQAGWSIVIHGVAHQTSYIVEGERPVVPWLGDTPCMLRIARTSMTGRRVNPDREPDQMIIVDDAALATRSSGSG